MWKSNRTPPTANRQPPTRMSKWTRQPLHPRHPGRDHGARSVPFHCSQQRDGGPVADAVGRSDTIYFNEGRLVSAASTDPDMGLAETLLRTGELNIQQYNHAMERLVVARRIGGLLCELGYLKPDDLTRAVERQANAIVLNAMSYRSGSYTIEFTGEFPEGIIALPLATERLILDGVRRIEYWSLIMRGVGVWTARSNRFRTPTRARSSSS